MRLFAVALLGAALVPAAAVAAKAPPKPQPKPAECIVTAYAFDPPGFVETAINCDRGVRDARLSVVGGAKSGAWRTAQRGRHRCVAATSLLCRSLNVPADTDILIEAYPAQGPQFGDDSALLLVFADGTRQVFHVTLLRLGD